MNYHDQKFFGLGNSIHNYNSSTNKKKKKKKKEKIYNDNSFLWLMWEDRKNQQKLIIIINTIQEHNSWKIPRKGQTNLNKTTQ